MTSTPWQILWVITGIDIVDSEQTACVTISWQRASWKHVDQEENGKKLCTVKPVYNDHLMGYFSAF